MQKFVDFMKLAGALTWRDIRETDNAMWCESCFTPVKAFIVKAANILQTQSETS